MSEPIEVKNKFKFNNAEYCFATDEQPREGSTYFITSGAVAEWVTSLSVFADRGVTQNISEGCADIPTSHAVWNKYKNVVYYNPDGKLYRIKDNGTTETIMTITS